MRREGISDEPPSLRDYLKVVGRRKWIVAQAAVLVPVAAIAFSLLQPPMYEATSEVLLSNQNLASALNGVTDPWVEPQRLAQTQAELADSPTVAERVVEQAGVRDLTPGDFLAMAAVEAKPDADLLEFRVTARSPDVAMLLATAYGSAFTEYRRELDTGAIVRAREEVSERLRELRVEGRQDSPLYASLADKEQQLRTMEALQTSNAQVTDAADEATQVQPKPVRNGALGLVLGLILGVGLAFLVNALDTRIRDADEIAERLDVPLLARLPRPPRRLRKDGRLAMLADVHGPQAEAFRMLAMNLDFVNVDLGAKTIVITSAIEGEGKSTTAANLAVALAKAGRRTALVDLDLRRPSLHAFFGLEQRPGITQVAAGSVPLDEALARIVFGERSDEMWHPVTERPRPSTATPHVNATHNGETNGHGRVDAFLELLRAGPTPPDASAFLRTKALAEVLSELRERADIVVVDSPPLLRVGDALGLANSADAYLLVVRANVVRRPMLDEARRLLVTSRVPTLGFVMTGAEDEGGYGYGYGHRGRERSASQLATERVA